MVGDGYAQQHVAPTQAPPGPPPEAPMPSPAAVTAFPRLPAPYNGAATPQTPTPPALASPTPSSGAQIIERVRHPTERLMHPSGVVPHLVHVPARTSARVPASQRRTPSAPTEKLCNCRNSKCLKLYCECFASGRYCAGCNCLNCLNNKENEAQRSKAIETILERNPNAFRPKIQFQQGDDGAPTTAITRHTKGCSCRKSNCLKKYCECFQAAIFCAATCRCKECKNYEGSEHLIAVIDTLEPVPAPIVSVARLMPTAAVKREAPPVASVQPEAKRQKKSAPQRGPAALPPSAGCHPAVPGKPDPARDAIKVTRDKKMQEFIAHMLVRLHMEAYTAEQKRKESSGGAAAGDGAMAPPAAVQAPAVPAAAATAPTPPGSRDWTIKEQATLSQYYVTTEGTLLSEFGGFLGKMCDKIEAQIAKRGD